MNKKILISLSIIAAIAAVVIGGTTAFFSNTETSTGNTFIAGAIDLKIDNECHLNGRVCAWYKNDNGFPPGYYWDGDPAQGSCDCTWELMDLDGKAIFNFTDVKPGDDGEDTISLHVDTNPAWVCAEISNVMQTENGCNSPELKVDGTCDTPGPGQGELWDNLTFSIWMDDNCDNIPDSGELPYLVENANATDIKWAIADSQTGQGPIRDACIGVAWSVPDGVGNIIQSDSVTGDITFKAYQARHNDNFVCYAQCGNGIVEPGEECDGSAPEHYICTNECKLEYQPYCGDGTVGSGETCEYPNTTDNSYCSQSTSQCDDAKTMTRDGYGNCDGICGCVEDNWSNPVCIKGSCDAGCDSDDDCDDANQNTTDTCNMNTCACENTYVPSCGNGVLDGGEECDDNNNTSLDGCSATCKKEGQITVTKSVTNNNGGKLGIPDFSLFVDDKSVSSGVTVYVSAGAHTVSEAGVFGYTALTGGDCDDSGNVNVTGGESKSCTITNDDIAPSIRLIKNVSGGSALPDDFDVSINHVVKTSGSSNPVMANTAHVIDEEVMVSGYSFTSLTGTSYLGVSCPTALEGTITLLPGDVVTCTITNTKQP